MPSGTFTYANPRTVHWGADSLDRCLALEISEHGATRVLVITTRSVARDPDLGGQLDRLLGERRVGPQIEIGQHAPAAAVAAATDVARQVRPDLIVSFGGGSPIDAAKVVAFALATDLDLHDPRAATTARQDRPGRATVVPHVAIPTTLSAAEMSGLAGFTESATRDKVGLRDESLIPRTVIFDARLSLHTPLELWLSTGVRAIDHAVETLLAPGAHPLSDTLALEALSRLKSSLLATRADPGDLDARTESQLGAWFSFTLPAPAATGLSHILGKRIGSRHAIPHGITSCLLLPHVMRYLEPRHPSAQHRIARALGAADPDAAHAAAEAVDALIAELGLPRRLRAYGLSDADLRAAAEPVAGPDLPLDDLIAIYRAAL